ncbi:MAG TPA: GNAT family N-acetyltransferase [Geobacteraceae bacterium]
MEIDRFGHDDIGPFLRMALSEGWVCDRWEFSFLLRHFPQGCFVVRGDDGPVAFVTAVKYGTSGWLGNLIVAPELRGQGYGSALLESALGALVHAGVRTVWLTASEAGQPIYERLGFVTIDVVERWRGAGKGGRSLGPTGIAPDRLLQLDAAGWGDQRETILAEVVARGSVFAAPDGFLVSQKSSGGVQFGPWSAEEDETAHWLFDQALAAAGKDTGVFLDVPAANGTAARFLAARGFVRTGNNLLMYLGEPPGFRPGRIYALASMGSMG